MYHLIQTDMNEQFTLAVKEKVKVKLPLSTP